MSRWEEKKQRYVALRATMWSERVRSDEERRKKQNEEKQKEEEEEREVHERQARLDLLEVVYEWAKAGDKEKEE